MMRFSTSIPGVFRYPPVSAQWEAAMGPADFQTVARAIDELGFDSVAIPEHIVMPSEMIELMGANWPHALTVMAFVAGATSRVMVDSSVIVLPYHQPIVLAKAISTLDVLSGGRVRISIGVGHAEREFEVLDVPFRDRGRVADEYLEAMLELWTAERPEYHGTFVDFEDIAFEPKPIQSPHPPIWIGGNSKPAMRRAVRYDGWYPWLIQPAELPRCLGYMRSLPEYEGRTAPLDVCMPVTPLAVDEQHRPLTETATQERSEFASPQILVDAIGELADLGVTWVSIAAPPARDLDEHVDGLHWLAAGVLTHFR